VRVAWAPLGDEPRRIVAARLVHALTGSRLAHGPCTHCGGAHGRPHRVDGGVVSLAYTPTLVVVAVAASGGLGVDAEPGAPDTAAGIERLRPGTTLREWTRIEAALKAVGRGIPDADVAAIEIFGTGASWRTRLAGRDVRGRDHAGPAGVVISVAVAAEPAAASDRSTR
jgi:4'-phosphopantetheinyl transferase